MNPRIDKQLIFSLGRLVISPLVIALCSIAANAANKLDVELESGAEYDSNLAVVELDQYSSAGDWALLANARVNAQWQATPKATFKTGASYNSKTYRELSAFDLGIQQLFADASYELPLFKLGLSYHQADAALDGTDFLTLRQHSVYLSRLFNQRTFVRGAVNYQDKDFPTSSERNAHNLGVMGDVFVFFQQGNTFLAAGFTREEEEAAQDQFNYDALSLRASINHKFSVWGKASKLQLGMRYHDRDYSSAISATDSRRSDNHRVANVEWEIYLTPKITATSKIEKGNYESNFAAADYSETLASVTFAVTF